MKDLNTASLVAKAQQVIQKVRPYSFILFFVLVAAIYGGVLLRVQSLGNQTPSDDAVSSQVEAARVPRIDQKIVDQLNSLEDNSVSIKTLFDEARSNPFGQ